jgi:uncharacterized glyoxalase superfamily protein PhnB
LHVEAKRVEIGRDALRDAIASLTFKEAFMLGSDMNAADDGAIWSGIALAHNVRSREDAPEIIEQARTTSAEITRDPAETFYRGYAGVFRALDGHVWEVAHDRGFGLDDDGNVVLPR